MDHRAVDDISKQIESGEAPESLWSWKIIPVAIVTALILSALIHQLGGMAEFGGVIRHARWEWLAVAGAIVCFSLFVITARFRVVVQAIGYRPGMAKLFQAVVAVWPLGFLLPSRSNDLFRAYILRDDLPGWKCIGALLAERAVDLQTLVLFSAVGCLLLGLWIPGALAIVAWLSGWGLLWFLHRWAGRVVRWKAVSRFRDKLEALSAAFDVLKQNPRALLIVQAISMLAWGNITILMVVLCAMYGVEVSWMMIMAFWPVALVVGMLPITVAGLGTRDAAFVALLTVSHSALVEADVVAVTMTYALVTMVLPSLLGTPFLARSLMARSDRQ